MANFGMYKGNIRSEYILISEDNREKMLSNNQILTPKNSYLAGSDGSSYEINKPTVNNNYVELRPSEDITSNGITIQGLDGATIGGSNTYTWNVNSPLVLKRQSNSNWSVFTM